MKLWISANRLQAQKEQKANVVQMCHRCCNLCVSVCLQRRSGWPILTAITTWDSPAARMTKQSTTRALFRMFWCAWLCCIYWFKAKSNSFLHFTVCAVFQNIWLWSNLKCGKHLECTDCTYFSFSLIVWHKWYFCMVLMIHNHKSE